MRPDARKVATLAVVLISVVLGGCTDIEDAMASVDILNFMREAPYFDPYESPRDPPPLSVPVESPAGKWEPDVEVSEASLRAWGDTLTNPLAMNEQVLEAGARSFQIYCAVCHGVTAQGDGPIVAPDRLPFATNLLLPTTVQRTDGYIYAVIRLGRGLMPSYQRIPPQERWAVVNYVRYLQDGGDPISVELPGVVQPGLDQFDTAGAAGAGTEGADADAAGQE